MPLTSVNLWVIDILPPALSWYSSCHNKACRVVVEPGHLSSPGQKLTPMRSPCPPESQSDQSDRRTGGSCPVSSGCFVAATILPSVRNTPLPPLNCERRASPLQTLVSLIGTPQRLLVCVCIIRVGKALGSATRCRRLTLSQSTIATPDGSAVYGRDLHANGITRIVGLSLYCGGGRHHSHHEDCPDRGTHLSLHYVQTDTLEIG